jgi:hypothetical protein
LPKVSGGKKRAHDNDKMPSPSPALQALLSPLCSDAWVQCDSCELWRRVPKDVSERLGDDEQW